MADTSTKAQVLVIGIGNLLLHDEGVGVHIIRELEKARLPDFVEILDGGTRGADLLDSIADRRKVIVIDAVDADVTPGTVMKLTPQDLAPNDVPDISLHEFGIVQTLKMASHLNCAPKEVVIIAVKPADLSPGVGLSEIIKNTIPKILALISGEITR